MLTVRVLPSPFKDSERNENWMFMKTCSL